MSLTFSFDNWDQLLDSAAPTPTLSSTQAPSPSTASTGEFHPYVAVGLSVAGGGDCKLFALLHGGRVDSLCCGVIGTSKFCLRPSSLCGVLAHSKKYEVDASSLYLKENEHRAFIKPSFLFNELDEETLETLVAGKHTLQDLSDLFDSFKKPQVLDLRIDAPELNTQSVSVPFDSVNSAQALTIQDSFNLESSKFAMEETGIFSAPPQLSFEVDDLEDGDMFSRLEGSQPADFLGILREFQDCFVTLKTKWTQTFMEVDSSHSILIGDLKAVNARLSLVKC
jgi:hypothetical protein